MGIQLKLSPDSAPSMPFHTHAPALAGACNCPGFWLIGANMLFSGQRPQVCRNLLRYNCLLKLIAAYYITATQLLLFVRTAQYRNSASHLYISSVFLKLNVACYNVSIMLEKIVKKLLKYNGKGYSSRTLVILIWNDTCASSRGQ